MNKIEKLKAGDIILYKGNSWLSKGIQFFMRRYRKKLGIADRTIFNHAAMIIEYKDTLYVAEANASGIEVNPFTSAYGDRMHMIKIISPKKAYSKSEKAKISDTAISYAFDPTRYDFFNFIFQINMIRKTNSTSEKKWIGPKGDKARNRLYCTEAVATWANDVRPNTFSEPWTVNPLDVDLNKYYKEIYNGVS